MASDGTAESQPGVEGEGEVREYPILFMHSTFAQMKQWTEFFHIADQCDRMASEAHDEGRTEIGDELKAMGKEYRDGVFNAIEYVIAEAKERERRASLPYLIDEDD